MVSWAFYTSLLSLEHARARDQQSEPVLLLVIFAAIYDLLGVLYDDRSALSSSLYLERITVGNAVVVTAVAAIGVLRKWIHWRASEGEDTLEEKLLARSARQQAVSPFDRAGVLSRIAYWWISPFIALGIKRRFEVSDVPELPVRDATDVAARVFKRALEHELRSPAPSFLRVARRLYGAEVLLFAVWSTLNKLIGLASPVLIKLFLDWADETEPSLSKGYWLAAAMVARSVLASVSGTQYSLAWKRFDIRVRAGVISAIYDRSLALSSSAKRRYGLGRITNLISVDLGRLVGMPGTVFDMFLIPAEIVIALFLLSREVSYAFVAGVVVLGVMLPIQTLLGGKIQSVTKSMLEFRDARVNITAESLKAIKTLKLLAWVDVQLEKMDAYRQLEMGRLAVRKYLDALCVFFWASTPVIVQTSVFAAVIYSGHDITAANAFTAVSLLDRLIFPMNYFPWIINGFLEARVSALRIREFLFASAESETFVAPRSLPPSKSGAGNEILKNAVEISDCIFTWGQQGDDESNHVDEEEEDTKTPLMRAVTPLSVSRASAFELSIEHLFLQQSQDYVVCGSVGAGKSSLLLALLGEMRRQSGQFSVLRRRAAYAPQTPWLFQGSVRQNITLCDEDAAEQIDEALYRLVLQVCELEQDLREKPRFDRAQVGENGSNFSGGQRLRINLARALYQRTGLYLLDDPFSGLDSRTATKIVKNCFGSVSQRKQLFPDGATVVLVTHSIHLLELFPREVEVVVMESGGVIESGSYEALAVPGSATRLQAMVSEANRERQRTSSSAADLDGVDDSVETVESKVVSDASDDDPESKDSHDDSESEDHAEEHRESGVVNLRVWKAYASSIGWPLSLTILLSVVVMQVSRNGLDWWIGVYTNSHSVSPRVFADTLLWITFVNCTAVFFRSFLFAFGGLSAARSVYSRLVTSIFSASLSFFDATPVGRILNRLSGDTYSVDESLPFILNIFLKDFADVLGALVILFYGNKFVLLLLVPLSVFYFRLQQRYRPAARHVRRLDSVTQSPILTMFTETLEGLHVIRAMKLQHEYAAAYGRCLNLSQRMSFLGANTGAWFGIRLDMLGVCVTSFVAITAVAEFHITGAVNPGILGLTLTYALPIVSKLNAVLGSFIDTEQQMIAVERVKEYTDLPDEESVVSNSRKLLTRREALAAPASSVSSVWPRQGEIEFNSLTVSYTVPGSARSVTALFGVSCKIGAGEKIGVCGRTGAGKSTFLNAIFRAVVWKSGSISVDGVNLEALSLRELRSKLTYIPQEVVLFSGTLRSNLDPKDRFEDHVLWAALTKCGLDTAVAKLARGLESLIESGDATLSKGQSQLLCIARALLRPSKVLCIDEATASVDLETEQLVAEVLSVYVWLYRELFSCIMRANLAASCAPRRRSRRSSPTRQWSSWRTASRRSWAAAAFLCSTTAV